MLRILGLCALVFLLGCGSGSGTVPVKGVIMLDGQPLANASIQFVPDGTGKGATGSANEKGEFVLSTVDPRDGAMPGKYKVVVTPATPMVKTPDGLSADQAMALANKPQPKPTGPQVPAKYTRPDQTPLTQEVPAKGAIKIEISSKG